MDGQAAVNMTYPDMNATVVYSKIADSYLPSEIEGEKGNLLMSGIHVIHDVTFIPHRKPMSGQGPEEERQAVGVEIDKSDYFYETAEFIDLVKKGKVGIGKQQLGKFLQHTPCNRRNTPSVGRGVPDRFRQIGIFQSGFMRSEIISSDTKTPFSVSFKNIPPGVETVSSFPLSI